MSHLSRDIDRLPPDRLSWSDVRDVLTTDDGYPECDICDEPAELQTFGGPRCRLHGDVIEPDQFVLDAMSHS